MADHDDNQDRLIDCLLREALGKEQPPNLAERILGSLAEGEHAGPRKPSQHKRAPATSPAPIWLRWIVGGLAALLALGVGVWLATRTSVAPMAEPKEGPAEPKAPAPASPESKASVSASPESKTSANAPAEPKAGPAVPAGRDGGPAPAVELAQKQPLETEAAAISKAAEPKVGPASVPAGKVAEPPPETVLPPQDQPKQPPVAAVADAGTEAVGGAGVPARRDTQAAGTAATGRPAGKSDFERGTLVEAGGAARSFEMGGYCRIALQAQSSARIAGKEGAEELFLVRGAVSCEVDSGKGSFGVTTGTESVRVAGGKFEVRLLERTAKPGSRDIPVPHKESSRDSPVPHKEGGANMSGKHMLVKVLVGTVLVSGAWGTLSLSAGEDGGTAVGTLVNKGENWISVKSDGQDEGTMYMPRWIGGLPQDGGGFDKEMLAAFKGLVVGSKLKVAYKQDERLRAVGVDVLSVPDRVVEVAERPHTDRERPRAEGDRPRFEGDRPRPDGDRPRGEKERMEGGVGDRPRGDKPERAHGEKPEKPDRAHGDKPEKHGDQPKSGTTIGVVSSKGEGFIEIKTSREAEPERYVPRWVGKGEGGADRNILKEFQKLQVGQWVKIEWTMDERKRAVKVTPGQ